MALPSFARRAIEPPPPAVGKGLKEEVTILRISDQSRILEEMGRYEVEIRHVDDPHGSGFLPCQRRHIKQPLREKWALRSYRGWRTVTQKIKGYLAWKSIIFEHLSNSSDFFASDIIYLGNLNVSVLLPCQSRYIQLWHDRIWGLSSHIWWRTVAPNLAFFSEKKTDSKNGHHLF